MIDLMKVILLMNVQIESYSICYGDDGCQVRLYTDFEIDENGYYKIPVVNNGRFNVHIENNAVKSECQYNGYQRCIKI